MADMLQNVGQAFQRIVKRQGLPRARH
jgi:hypothetical protein